MEKVSESKVMDGNKLIADFMGWTWPEEDWYKAKELREMKYHKRWDWLMPVFIKIGTMWMWQVDKFGCTICVLGRPPIEYGVKGGESNNEESIKHCAWLASVEFIKWYNLSITPTSTL